MAVRFLWHAVLKLLAEWKSGRPVVRNADTELDSKITDAIKTQMQRAAVLTAKLEAAERRATEADARTTKADAAARELEDASLIK